MEKSFFQIAELRIEIRLRRCAKEYIEVITMIFHVIINPAGASGSTLKAWKKLKIHLDADRVRYIVHESTAQCGIEAICRELTAGEEQSFPLNLIVIGGDGTMNEVINGIRDLSKVTIAFLPAGSGNDLARDLGLTRDLASFAKIAISRGTASTACPGGHKAPDPSMYRQVDVGEIVCRHATSHPSRGTDTLPDHTVRRRFLVSAGIGFDAETCAQVATSPMKKFLNRLRLGKLIYVAVAARLIFTTRPARFNITYQDAAQTAAADMPTVAAPTAAAGTQTAMVTQRTATYRKALFAAIMNHRYEGGGFRFCPDAVDNDGRLDLCIASPKYRMDFFRMFPYSYSGNHLRFKGIEAERAEVVRIRADRPLWIHTDGEVPCQSDDICLRILPQKLSLLMTK